MTENTGRKLSRVPQTAQTDYAAELAIGNPVHHLAHRRHWRPIEQAFKDPVYAGEPLEKTLGVCADFVKVLLPDPMLRLRTGFRRPAGRQRAFIPRRELILRLYEMNGNHHHQNLGASERRLRVKSADMLVRIMR